MERTINTNEYTHQSDTANAECCSQSNKVIKNNSVFCNLLDQWISINYCANLCRAPEIKGEIKTVIFQTVDNLAITKENDVAVTDTKEATEALMGV